MRLRLGMDGIFFYYNWELHFGKDIADYACAFESYFGIAFE